MESSLSLLSEPHLKRLRHNGFRAVLPGIESWFDLGNKSNTGTRCGLDKVRQVSERPGARPLRLHRNQERELDWQRCGESTERRVVRSSNYKFGGASETRMADTFESVLIASGAGLRTASRSAREISA